MTTPATLYAVEVTRWTEGQPAWTVTPCLLAPGTGSDEAAVVVRAYRQYLQQTGEDPRRFSVRLQSYPALTPEALLTELAEDLGQEVVR